MEGKSYVASASRSSSPVLISTARYSSARCSVTLANVGEDAYQPEVFGKQITIERTLNKAGGGAYKIKNAESKTVDTKKALLDAIRTCAEMYRSASAL